MRKITPSGGRGIALATSRAVQAVASWFKGARYGVVAALLGVVLIALSIPSLREAFSRTPWDLNVDYRSAQAYRDGYSPFTAEGAVRSGVAIAGPSGFGHPPTTAFWALPLSYFPLRTAGHILAAMTCVLLAIQLFVSLRKLEFDSPAATAWLFFSYIVATPLMSYHFGLGQLSGVIGFLLCLGWWAGRDRHDVLAGVALGAACTLKLFPGVVVLFFLINRRWRAVFSAVAVYLGIAIVMTSRFGVRSWTTFFSVQSRIADLWMGNIQNQSIHGIVSRLARPVCVPPGPVNHTAMMISIAISAVLLGASSWLGRNANQSSSRFDLAYALFVALSVVTSQWVWEHYAIIYATPMVILLRHLRVLWRDVSRRTFALWCFAILLGIVATWRIDIHLKQTLQRSVLAGHRDDHLLLHAVDLANWLPGMALLGILLVTCYRQNQSMGQSRAATTSHQAASLPGLP